MDKDQVNIEENKEVYRLKLKRQPLRSEREEMKERRRNKIYHAITIIVVLLIGLEFGLLLGSHRMEPSETMSTDKFNEIAYYFENYWLYGDDYEDLANTLYDKALYGMTDISDDPYTTYASIRDMEEYNSSLNVEFVGIGITYRSAASGFVINKVYHDTPAYRAGLEAGDIIVGVNNEATTNMTSDDLKNRVMGMSGETVTLNILRDAELIDIDVVRGEVNSSVYVYNLDDVVVMELYSFGLNTYDDCKNYLANYSDYSKLIIDLRDNGGGYASAVEEIGGLFLNKGSVVMREVDKNGTEHIAYTDSDVYYDNFEEIIILTNSNTASASEVLTLALKENHPNTISIGTTSYGKGVVQSLYTLSDGSTLIITTMYWTSDDGTSIHGVGITPEVEIYLDDIYYEIFLAMDDASYIIDSVSPYNILAQKALRFLGYDIARVDGYFDESLDKAIREYQESHNLEVDGTLDKETYEAIMSSMYKLAYTDRSKDIQFMEAINEFSEG